MNENLFRGLVVLLAIALFVVLRAGVPVQLTLTNSGIPVTHHGEMLNEGRYQLVTSGSHVLRLDKRTGTIEVFFLESQGKLIPRDQK